MRRLPGGTVTLLFTDIEGSTRLLEAVGDEYADVLAEHRRVLREAFTRNDGVEVDTAGDGFFVAFARATDAVAAASEGQGALAAGPVRVRIGHDALPPVEAAGAPLQCADAHATQGDADVCVTGVEAPMYGEPRFTLQN